MCYVDERHKCLNFAKIASRTVFFRLNRSRHREFDGPFIPVLERSLALLSPCAVDRVDRDKLLPSPPPDLSIAAAEVLLRILSPSLVLFWCIG
ncbi:hypothetical protein VNO80_09756 [Phaseolus coccineus]|uniref:Uncharacterized protein n=1 Tax=Phaseolus coccineus TaxID=3886 RepID=A0AAN9NC40_PHACN